MFLVVLSEHPHPYDIPKYLLRKYLGSHFGRSKVPSAAIFRFVGRSDGFLGRLNREMSEFEGKICLVNVLLQDAGEENGTHQAGFFKGLRICGSDRGEL